MPQVELRVVEAGSRSTLYASKDGRLYRFYHDTKSWRGPLLPCVDGKGVSRHSHNRRVSDLVAQAWGGSDDDDGVTRYRGSHVPTSAGLPSPPDHLHTALSQLLFHPRDIDDFANMCGVKTSTAWNYACRIVEHWPYSHLYARRLVYQPLLEVCESTCLDGSLRHVLERLQPVLSGDVEWRCLTDHYAHLRLARLCLEAERDLKPDNIS